MLKSIALLSAPLCAYAFGGAQAPSRPSRPSNLPPMRTGHRPGSAQHPDEPKGSHNSEKWQIWAISTAAPAEIGLKATIMNHKQEMLRQGSNGWTCMPTNPKGPSKPHKGWLHAREASGVCVDANGLEWMKAYMSGKKPEVKRDVIAYMLNGDQGGDNILPGITDEKKATEWVKAGGPHIMLMPKNPESIRSLPTDFTTGEPYVMWKGTPYAHVMIPYDGYEKFINGVAARVPTEPAELPHTSKLWQIWAYSTAAPPQLGKKATVLDGEMNELRKGSNGWTCMPANPRGPKNKVKGWKDAHEAMPVCFDAAGMDWMQGWMSGTAPKMKRSAFVWMKHGDMGEDNTKPGVMTKQEAKAGHWIESGNHLMLMPKDIKDIEQFTTDFTTGEPYLMFKGSPYAHLMIPMEGYFNHQHKHN